MSRCENIEILLRFSDKAPQYHQGTSFPDKNIVLLTRVAVNYTRVLGKQYVARKEIRATVHSAKCGRWNFVAIYYF